MSHIFIDFETKPIGPGQVYPDIICGGFYDGEEAFGLAVEDSLFSWIKELLEGDTHLLFHNAKYDMSCICSTWPELIPLVFEAYANDRIHCTQNREKLLNLAFNGKIDMVPLPDGSWMKMKYRLFVLEKQYLGIDRSGQKEEADSWRTNYEVLEGLHFEEYPQEAQDYVLDDVRNPWDIFWLQEERAQKHKRCDPLKTETFQNAADFALGLMTSAGWQIDLEEKAKVEAMIAEELKPENMRLMLESGVLRPEEPPRPYANGAKDKKTGEPKMTKGKKESVNETLLKELVASVWQELGKEPVKTKPTDKYPEGAISFASEVLEELAPHNPILAEFKHRADLSKIFTTELPRMGDLGIVYPNFDVLKETGRTSSWAGDLYPSFNAQNVDPRVRQCYKARDGWALASVDFDFLELVSAGQKCYELFGRSVLRDKINAGIDPHAYLGAQLCYHLDENFRAACESPDPDLVYEAFVLMKTSEHEELRKLFKHYRTFAKPTGLGYPGGLGPATFVTYAKGTFGIEVSEEMAKQLREIWFDTYPEFREYFDWVNSSCNDPDHDEQYAYISPLGMYRANASFCATANGAALQTPSAEGAKLGVFLLARACYDPTFGSCLYGCRPLAFIHDQNIVEIPEDDWMQERAFEIARLMVAAMEVVMTDTKVGAEPLLMRKWSKYADPVYDENNRLTFWEPDASAA